MTTQGRTTGHQCVLVPEHRSNKGSGLVASPTAPRPGPSLNYPPFHCFRKAGSVYGPVKAVYSRFAQTNKGAAPTSRRRS